ncbi:MULTISPECIES: TolC family protein [unclassified Flavobacterium]|jgi:outer membrane protein|uniref:TolC family protein n=1 Tax=unclassified Flavobacterium TaxID=196869 RepID=UPI0010655888|nr:MULTISPECIES: TolC family protein [unclassified Flavobacterium]MDQ1164220.1 outer membrane protein [Flavobacterium sp. SORGH_AS_0622]TDX14134.1 outer membrane protein [Flavobacterium sp. S87F.05.LMB.W.Kidney.N]BDU24772.1 transporter [Flavobacterium sp. GSB-24]
MKINKINSLVFAMLFGFGLAGHAQSKQWTLEECVRYALENNITIKLSELDVKNADIDKKGALGNYLPSVNGNASHSWNIGLNQDVTTGILRNQTTQYSSVGLNAGVDIYKGLQNQNTYRRAKLSIIASKYQLLKMQEDISLNVASAFLQILSNKEDLKVKKEQLSIDEKRFARSEEMVNAGTIPRGDLFDLKATVATDKQNIAISENNLLISKLSLAQLLQLKEFADFDVIDNTNLQDENNILGQTPVEIYNKAKDIRTEVKLAQTNLEIAEKNVAIAKGAYQPTLSGFYGFNTRASYSDQVKFDANDQPYTVGPDPIFQQFSDNKGHNFGLQLNVPIFNGWSVKNNVERNKVSLEKSKIDLEQKSLDLQRNVYTAFTDAKAALNTYEASTVTLEARQQAYNYAKEKYDVGLMNSFDFTQAQTLLTNAQSDVIRTKYDYMFKIKILEFYFGIPIVPIITK